MLIGASLAFAIARLVGGASDQDGIQASLLAVPLSAAALVAGALALRKPPQSLVDLGRGWAADLALVVKDQEQRYLNQLLGEIAPKKINLTYTILSGNLPELSASPPTERGRLFNGTATDPDIVDFYKKIPSGRLVVTGEPGSGKTGLIVELILRLLEQRNADDPVPVRLSMPDWDTHIPPGEYLTQHLVNAYDWHEKAARTLVEQGRILPVLDGLDEMDSTHIHFDPTQGPQRAVAALELLNDSRSGFWNWPVVLTCRSAQYDALLNARERLWEAVRVEIDAVPAAEASSYLDERAQQYRPRWGAVRVELESNPMFAANLSTPWRLCLASTVYFKDGDPAELLAHSDDLDDFLLARYIPAATQLHRDTCTYQPENVHLWLWRLATHLERSAPGASGGPSSDLLLHELWPLAGRLKVRVTDALITGLAGVLALLVAAPAIRTPGDAFLPVCAIAFAAVAVFLTKEVHPMRIDLRFLSDGRSGRLLAKNVAAGFAGGFLFAAFLWAIEMLAKLTGYAFLPNQTPGQSFTLTLTLTGVMGPVIAVTGSLTDKILREKQVLKPRQSIREDLVCGASIAFLCGMGPLLFGAPIGLMVEFLRRHGFIGGQSYGYIEMMLNGIAVLLPITLPLGALIGFAGCCRASRRYLVFLFWYRRRLPFRLAAFLDWSSAAGLLRISGTAYQFRHRELQQWLVRHGQPTTGEAS